MFRSHTHTESAPAVQQLLDSVGRCHAVVMIQPLDIHANAYGKPLVYRGILKRVTTPDIDSESTAAGMLVLEFVVDGVPSTWVIALVSLAPLFFSVGALLGACAARVGVIRAGRRVLRALPGRAVRRPMRR